MLLNDAFIRYQQRVDQLLKAKLNAMDDAVPQLKSAMEYSLLIGGKRIRPFLVYSIGEMLKVDINTLDNCACAIECIHAYSLIHDDLPSMDNDELRRGKPTVHIAFDEATAILAGDALQSLAFDIISEPNEAITDKQQLAMVRVLAKASGYQGMCGGQAIDLASTNICIDIEELTLLHKLKTGALISCAVELALICAHANKTTTDILLNYANNLGLAFQVQDDILDVTGTTEEIGKPQGSDIESNKNTFPKLLGLEQAKLTAQKLIENALLALDKLPYNNQLITNFARYVIERRI